MVVYGCGNKTTKFIVFSINLIIFIVGGLILGISLWANFDKNFGLHLQEFANKIELNSPLINQLAKFHLSLWILAVIGAFLLLLGFFGYCGAMCESIFVLSLFYVLLKISIIIEAIILVFMIENRTNLLYLLKLVLIESSKTEVGRMNLLPIEKALSCCGATFETAKLYSKICIDNDLINMPDCNTVISDKMESRSEIIFGVLITLIFFQLLSIIFSFVLCRAFRSRGTRYYA